MSGFVALFERRGQLASRAHADAMLARLAHRGPDGVASFAEGPVVLGHALLATTPEDVGALGARRFGGMALVGDVRLDDRPGLAAALSLAPGELAALGDGDLVLRAYARWGEGCAAHLLGDFAFALWDAAKRTLFCARDALGVRSLYFASAPDTFRCASEPHALFGDPRLARRASFSAMASYLAGEYTEVGETLWEGVSALGPGTALLVTEGATRVFTHWRPDPERRVRHGSDRAYAEHFAAVFADAVGARLRCVGPVFAQVSGGLDSSAVAAEAAFQLGGASAASQLGLVRVTFEGLACDESAHSQAVATHLGLPLASVDGCAPSALGPPRSPAPDIYFDPTLRMLEPLLALARARGARVMLTGIGGDQLMQPTEHDGAAMLRRGEVGGALAWARAESPSLRGALRLLLAQATTASLPPRALARLRRVRHPASVRWPLLSPRAQGAAMAQLEAAEAARTATASDPQIAWFCRAISASPSTSLALALLDRAGPRGGAELRHPFLDRRVVELLLALPMAQRSHAGETKRVLRHAMVGRLPPSVLARRDKAAFDCYVRRLMVEEHPEGVRQLFRDSRLEAEGVVDGARVSAAFSGPDEPSAGAAVSLVALELWLRTFDPAPARTPSPDPRPASTAVPLA